ncbi:MAG TPA: DUF4097 family beta strand repeat-containing protein [Actinophytocola sp.]|jgi:DUF4097 and DUF4098 domain-containing protein YvlB|nr:DUF4097 family beta strand repeat-containing protein [Actinophytocola sp.]
MGIGRAVAAAAIGITGIGLLAACGWNTRTYSDASGVGRSFSSVRFTNDSGDVTIRTGDRPEVKREVHYGDDQPGEGTFRVKNGVLELDSCGRTNCWIDYEVTVPAGTSVSGQLDSGTADITGVSDANVRASSGDVTIKNVSGAVNVEASSGSVTLDGIGGQVVAKASSGDVNADGVDGDVTLEASSGSVEARGIGGATKVESSSGGVVVELTEAADVRVGAQSGNVEVTVPDGAYKVLTSTGSGNVNSDVENDPAGDHRLDLHTDSGDITVSHP